MPRYSGGQSDIRPVAPLLAPAHNKSDDGTDNAYYQENPIHRYRRCDLFSRSFCFGRRLHDTENVKERSGGKDG
jgi:hypothetical protein